ncbi:hypothetical protein BDQ17DRAFT_1437340 [Cyathus striatus]|nr:hypothetical protein BDQ17DRAFT_1437340 [Cyathus striatus]
MSGSLWSKQNQIRELQRYSHSETEHMDPVLTITVHTKSTSNIDTLNTLIPLPKGIKVIILMLIIYSFVAETRRGVTLHWKKCAGYLQSIAHIHQSASKKRHLEAKNHRVSQSNDVMHNSVNETTLVGGTDTLYVQDTDMLPDTPLEASTQNDIVEPGPLDSVEAEAPPIRPRSPPIQQTRIGRGTHLPRRYRDILPEAPRSLQPLLQDQDEIPSHG